jgi:hypothetical protein
VSSRTRHRGVRRFVEHLSIDHIGQPSFEGAHGLHRRPAGGESAPVVGAAWRIAAELDDGHDVQDPVDAPVPGPGQAVALLVAGGGVQGCGAVPGGEVAAAGEAVDVADVADWSGGAGRADPIELLQAAAGGLDQFGQFPC